MGTHKPTSSNKAVGPKQKQLRRVKLSALRNYRGTTVTVCIVSVKKKILAALQSKYEHPKLLMLQIGNKYPFDA